MKLYANLHLHSTHSDGVYSPTELAKLAYDEGYQAAALTDHDVVTGNEEFMAACRALGMDSIFGVEFYAKTHLYTRPNGKHGSFHITAYDFDPEYPAMKEYLRQMSLRETDQTYALFERGVKIGYIKDITWREVEEYNKGITWLCNDHVFRAMKAKGVITDLQYNEYFETCFGKHRSAIPALYDFQWDEEIISLVHKAGGIAVLAHPEEELGKLEDVKAMGYGPYVDRLMEMGLDGVEVFHPSMNDAQRKATYEMAVERGLYISGGSDHSGLCGGQYDFYEDPKSTRFYIEPLSAGTTREHFEEIRDKRKGARN